MKQIVLAGAIMMVSLSAAQSNPPLPPHNPLRQDAAQEAESLPPMPRRKPEHENGAEADADAEKLPPLPRSKPERDPPETAIPAQPLNEPCGGALKDFTIVAERLAPIEDGECGREEVLSVTAVGTVLETARPSLPLIRR